VIFIFGYGSIPINTIFRGMNIHKSQLFWCSLQGYYWFWHTARCFRNPPVRIEDIHPDSQIDDEKLTQRMPSNLRASRHRRHRHFISCVHPQTSEMPS
jgi:hypothetical protein